MGAVDAERSGGEVLFFFLFFIYLFIFFLLAHARASEVGTLTIVGTDGRYLEFSKQITIADEWSA